MQRTGHARRNRSTIVAVLMATGLLAACAKKPVEIVAVPLPPPPAPVVMPKPPRGSAASLSIPNPLPDGSFATPNRGLTPAASIWHLRSGLNVAALQCGGASSDQYNALLKTHRAALAAAFKQIETEYRGGGGDWQDRFDDTMTRLYNYFAQPPAQKGFCEAALPLLAEATTIAPDAFERFARTALAAIDKPFADFWGEYYQYRVALAAWQGKQPGAASAVAMGSPAAPATGAASSGSINWAPSTPIVQAIPSQQE